MFELGNTPHTVQGNGLFLGPFGKNFPNRMTDGFDCQSQS